MTARTRAYRARIPRVVIRRWRRYRACGVVGIEPQFRTWDGSGEVVSFVVSLNLHRRHLDESQRALVAARIATLAQGQRADRSIDLSSVTQQDAADMLNVSVPSVKRRRRRDGRRQGGGYWNRCRFLQYAPRSSAARVNKRFTLKTEH